MFKHTDFFCDMQTFATRLGLRMKFANKHTIENKSSDKLLSVYENAGYPGHTSRSSKALSCPSQ